MEFARQDGWFRQGLYTLVLVPPCERCAFAVVRLLQDEVEYDEPGDAQFRPERYDHISQAVDRAEERWAEHRISLDYVNALTGRGATRAMCAVCGTKKFRIGAAPAHRQEN